MSPQTIKEHIGEVNPEALTADGFDDALIGYAERCGQPTLAVYDIEEVIDILRKRDGLSTDDAVEHFDFNIAGGWLGEHTPLWLTVLRNPDLERVEKALETYPLMPADCCIGSNSIADQVTWLIRRLMATEAALKQGIHGSSDVPPHPG